MKKRIFFTSRAAVCAGILSLVFFSAEAAFVGRVVVEVTDSNQNPVAGAVVELWSVVPGPPRSETRYDEKMTPQNGTLEFTQVKAGTYLVRVLCPSGNYLPTDDEDHDFKVTNKTIYQRFMCNTSGGGKGNTDKNSRTSPKGPAKIVQTGDWQPGDQVSFSFTGVVFGTDDTGESQADLTGMVVLVTDPAKNTTKIPASQIKQKVVEYDVPAVRDYEREPTAVEYPELVITFGEAFKDLPRFEVPIHPKGTDLPVRPPEKPTGNSFAFPVHQTGQPYYVYAPGNRLSGKAGEMKLVVTNKAGGPSTTHTAVAASPRTAMFQPKVKEPGEYQYKFIHEGRFTETFDVSVVSLKLDTSRAYRTNQKGVLDVIVTLPQSAAAQKRLLDSKFHVNIDMGTPNVLAFSSGKTQTIWQLSKGDINGDQAHKEFDVRAGQPGKFTITARATTPACSNPVGTAPSAAQKPATPITPADRGSVDDSKLVFKWEPVSSSTHPTYTLAVYEGSRPNIGTTKPVYVWKGDKPEHSYPVVTRSFSRGKHYSWLVKTFDGIKEVASTIREFTVRDTGPLKFDEPIVETSNRPPFFAPNIPTSETKKNPCEVVVGKIVGEAEIRDSKDGVWRPLKPGEKVPVGAEIATGEGSEVIVTYGRSGFSLIRELTFFRLETFECDDNHMDIRVTIDPGVAVVSVKQLPQFTTNFQVATPRLVSSVRG